MPGQERPRSCYKTLSAVREYADTAAVGSSRYRSISPIYMLCQLFNTASSTAATGLEKFCAQQDNGTDTIIELQTHINH